MGNALGNKQQWELKNLLSKFRQLIGFVDQNKSFSYIDSEHFLRGNISQALKSTNTLRRNNWQNGDMFCFQRSPSVVLDFSGTTSK